MNAMRAGWLALGLAALTWSSAAGEEGWPQLHGGADHANRRERTLTVRWPRIRWHVPGAWGQPSIGHGAVYAGGARLLRIDPERGEVLSFWVPPGKGDWIVAQGPALTASSVIVRLKNGAVVALDPTLRRILWTRAPERRKAYGWSSGALAGRLYVYADGRVVAALRAVDGATVWRVELPPGEQVEMTPAVAEDRVYLGTTAGRMIALDLRSGATLWSWKGRSAFKWSDPVVAFGRVFASDRGGDLHAWDPRSGELHWSSHHGGAGFSTPGVGSDALIGGFLTRLALFDPATGAMRETPRIETGTNPFGSPTEIGDALAFGNLDGSFYVHDRRTGSLRWAFRLRPGSTAGKGGRAPQVHDFVAWRRRLYVSTTEGLYCLEQDPEKETAPPGHVLEWTGR